MNKQKCRREETQDSRSDDDWLNEQSIRMESRHHVDKPRSRTSVSIGRHWYQYNAGLLT